MGRGMQPMRAGRAIKPVVMGGRGGPREASEADSERVRGWLGEANGAGRDRQ